MLAAVQDGSKLSLQEVDKPTLVDATDVLVKVTAAAPCTSDVHAAYLPPSPPYVTGHEFVGIVEEVGSCVKNFKIGDRICASAFDYCGICEVCRNGNSGSCPNGSRFGSGENNGNLPGALAEYVRAPRADVNLLKVPDNVSDEQAIFVGDMLSTGYYAISKCNLKPAATVVIIGAGPVGLCTTNVAKLFSPAKIIVVDRLKNRLDIALKLGATDIIDDQSEDVMARIMEITGGKGADAVIEAIGSPEAIESACHMVGVGGMVFILGFAPPGNIGLPLQELSFKDATIRIGMTASNDMPLLMNLLADGKLDVSPLVTHVLPFTDLEKAFEMFAKKQDNCIKVVLKL